MKNGIFYLIYHVTIRIHKYTLYERRIHEPEVIFWFDDV